MAKFSVLLSLLVAALVALNTHAFAPKPAFGVRPSTELAVKIKVNVGDGEPIESALRRFKRAVNSSGHLMELRHKRYFENPQEKKKRKVKEARIRIKFERMQRRRMANRT
mmetsp:Transcript_87107/g.251232  ORF Transcript_87107/g.251232 Transcript_87107/m.251232 type:complete len:110 (+) Transcript_87107:78-407(+)|eukprot:CAMPEP_0170201264 /NCGR_PEP_ID=MMETSP0116_2-20130129/82_1 /TAXON_ID=400756 /ORGANISM="Durinskia baltica, Strain CSIRO CS-38" /LENGTH=109 /DNA_ID=CAMNT_0010451467 /DNA_START=60 /DNA_END=389 /DNA_ORIENTATION=-